MKIQKYIARSILKHKCEVRYKYIENHDNFQKKIAFAGQHAGSRMVSSIASLIGVTAIVDRILVFKDGSIVEDGSHKQLMEHNGHYAQIYRAQAQWYA